MNSKLLADLSYLFSLEALEADRRGDDAAKRGDDRRGDDVEGDRLWDISSVLHARADAVRRHELVAIARMP